MTPSRLFGIFLLLVLCSPLVAQGTLGTVTGVVRDPTGAVIPAARITIQSKDRGTVSSFETTESGAYTAPHIAPDIYKIEASSPGFKTAIADNIKVHVAEVVNVDFTLEVGNSAESIEVTAEAPLIETGTSQIGTTITQTEFHTWPIILVGGIRQLQSFIFRSLPGAQGDEWSGSINGSPGFSHEVYIDGLSVNRLARGGGSNWEMSPSADAISEFKLQTGAISAQYGGGLTAVANFDIRSGTNKYHGSAYWFMNNKVLAANTWTSNAFGRARSPLVENNLGATLGGPIKKNRTHFFFSYEANRNRTQQLGAIQTLPLPEFKAGDFSRLLDPAFTGNPKSGSVIGKDALGRDVIYGQIYDPLSSRQLPDGTWIRDPFKGNIIPKSRFSDVSRKILELADTPDPELDQFRFNNPKLKGCCPSLNVDIYTIKIDHDLTQNHRLTGSFTFSSRDRYNGNPGKYLPFPGSGSSTWQLQSTPSIIGRFSHDWTIRPTVLNHLAVGYNRFRNKFQSAHIFEDWPNKIGLRNVGDATFPIINFGGSSATLSGGFVRMGSGYTTDSAQGSWIVADDLSWIHGNHSFRFGFEDRRYYSNNRNFTNGGSFTFHSEQTALPGFVKASGFSYASFLLGAVRNAGLGIVTTTPGTRITYSSFYFQDSWKLTPTLTLNYGLRWEIPGVWREVFNRMSGLDPTMPNPGADGFPGALAFVGDCPTCTGGNTFQNSYYRELGPRFGFAWSVRSNFVLRGGYGIDYGAPLVGAGYPFLAGFNGSNPLPAGTGRFAQDPVLLWDNGYPAFTEKLPNRDPAQQNHKGIVYLPPDSTAQAYVQNWNVGIQYMLPWQTVLEANYVGNKGTRINAHGFGGLFNQVNPRYLPLGDTLLENIASHPEIPKPYPSFKGTVGRALRPFPQFEGISAARYLVGMSNYQALQVTARKRARRGLTFLAAYTFSKALANTNSIFYGEGYLQDFYSRSKSKSPTNFHRPQSFRLSWIYEIPFGQGQRWLTSGPLSNVMGGWTVSGIHQYQSGSPLKIIASGYATNALFNSGIRGDVLLPADRQVIYQGGRPDSVNGTPYLNPAAFGAPPATPNGVPIRFGTAPRFLSHIRGPARYNEDLSLMKRTTLTERITLEIRADFRNFLNRAGLGNPITNVSDARFGRIYRNGNAARVVQLGARINF